MPSGPKEQSQVLFKVILVHMFCVFLSFIFTEKMQWSLFSFHVSLPLLYWIYRNPLLNADVLIQVEFKANHI